MCNKEHFEDLGDVKWFEDLKSAETMRVDGVMIKVDYSTENDARITPKELGSYLDRGRAKEPNRKLVWLHLLVEGDDAAIHYGYEPEKFERIRRITGYLVGTLDRFNDAKRAEESQRKKHMVAKKELQAGHVYSIDLYALLFDKLGSVEAIETLEDDTRIEIEFGQDLRVVKPSIPGVKPFVDLITDCSAAIYDESYVEVDFIDTDKVKLSQSSAWLNCRIEFELTPEHAAKYLY